MQRAIDFLKWYSADISYKLTEFMTDEELQEKYNEFDRLNPQTTMTHTTESSKEVLHTQGEWEVHSTGLLEHKAEIHPINDPHGLTIIADVYSYEDAELIVKAVNERQKLLDSNRELVEILEKIGEWRKLKDGLFTYTNSYGDNFDQQLKTAINNVKNIQL